MVTVRREVLASEVSSELSRSTHPQSLPIRPALTSTNHDHNPQAPEIPQQFSFNYNPPISQLGEQDYQMQLMLLEQQNKKRLMLSREAQDQQRCSTTMRSPKMGYPAGEHYSYNGAMMAKEEQDAPPAGRAIFPVPISSAATTTGMNYNPQHYQQQLMLLEQQNAMRLMVAKEERDTPPATSSIPTVPYIPGDNQSLQDYQFQMMLLEQQNKTRLMAARMEQDTLQPSSTDQTELSEHWSHVQQQDHRARFLDCQELQNKAKDVLLSQGQHAAPISRDNPAPPSNQVLQDYQMQLMLLEQQNKKRLMLARAAPPEPTPEESD